MSLTTDKEDGLSRNSHQSFRDTTQQQTPNAAPAVRTNNNKIGGPPFGLLFDRVINVFSCFDDLKKRRFRVYAERAS
jgi:hypothetical protein